jgi:hypothetical protein
MLSRRDSKWLFLTKQTSIIQFMGSIQQTKLCPCSDKVRWIFTEPDEKDRIEAWTQDLPETDNNKKEKYTSGGRKSKWKPKNVWVEE